MCPDPTPPPAGRPGDAGKTRPEIHHSSAANPLAFFEQFVFRFYSSQHSVVRAVVFVSVVAVLLWAAFRAIGGEFAVTGRILQRTPTGTAMPVRDHEVRVAQRQFGTNSMGEYMVVVNSFDYVRLSAGSPLPVEVIRGGREFIARESLKLHSRQELDDIFLAAAGAPADTVAGDVFGLAEPASPGPLEWLAPAAWAQSAAGGDRLVVRSLDLMQLPKAPREATFRARGAAGSFALLSSGTGVPIGTLPVVPGGIVTFGENYLFALTGTSLSGIYLDVQLGGGALLQKAPVESFVVPATLAYGRPTVLNGTGGARIEVRRLHPYDLVLFSKQDLRSQTDSLRGDFTRAGLRVKEPSSPLGYTAQTNALFAGDQVPFEVLQQVARLADSRGVKFKQIRYRMRLKSGRQNEVQLGGSRALDLAPVIPAARMQRILNAKSEAEFTTALSGAGALSGIGTAVVR